jgi:hypothetical protein
MTLKLRSWVIVATFLGLYGLLGGCFAQSEKNESVSSNPAALVVIASDADRAEILRTVRLAYETPTQKYLCSSENSAVREKVRSRFTEVFTKDILNEYFSSMALCDVLASARFGSILDTPEAVKQTYEVKFAEPYTLQGATVVEVRFRPLFKGKLGDEGGAIVYLKKLAGGWRITNIESVDYLGANGFRSLIHGYPTVSSDVWADMDYTKSLTRPSRRQY